VEALLLAWMIRAAVSREALRFEAVHEQEGDLSCGLAAAASDRHALQGVLETGVQIPSLDLLFLPSARVEWTRSSLAAGSTATWKQRDQRELAWRLALVNLSVPDTAFTLSVGQAARFPSLFELFGNSGRVKGNPELVPERALQVDGGVVYEATTLPAPYRLRVEAAGFYSRVEDLIQIVQTAQGVARSENVDRARLWGLEAGVRADLFAHLRLNGNYSYLDARNRGQIAARQDRYLPLRPASKWYARAEGYVREIPHVAELALHVEAEWIAGNFLDNANLVATSDRFFLDAGLTLELAWQRARVSLRAANLSNERTADLAGYPLPGRSFHLLLRMGAP